MQENNRDISLLKKRIIKYLDYKGVSKYEFYLKTKISNGILSQKSGISEENILKFLSYYKDINPTWLLTGEGNMLREGVEAAGAPEPREAAPQPPQAPPPAQECKQCALKDRIIESQQATIEAQQKTIKLLEQELESCGNSKKPPLPDILPAEVTAKLKKD